MPGDGARHSDVATLRAAVYRPGATSADVAALERALDELQREDAPAFPAGSPAADAGSASAGAAERAVPSGVRARGAAAPRRWSAVVAAVATSIAGCVAGVLLVLLGQQGDGADPPVPTALQIVTTARDAVFERAQRATDRPVLPLDGALAPGSIRRLLGAGSILLYAARDRRGHRCMIGVVGGSVLACVDDARFRSSGLRLLWSADVLTNDRAALRQLRFRMSLLAEWRPDGRVLLGEVAP
jgi:hypothetical protein